MLDRLTLALALIAPLAAASQIQPLRIAHDASHRWELMWDSVSVHDAATSQMLLEFHLEGAVQSGSRDTCPPDLVVTRSGMAYATSNIQPVIWRLDPSTARVDRLALEVDSDREKDFGFTGLVGSSDGQALYAIGSADGALWRIDPSALTASKIGARKAAPRDCARKANPRPPS